MRARRGRAGQLGVWHRGRVSRCDVASVWRFYERAARTLMYLVAKATSPTHSQMLGKSVISEVEANAVSKGAMGGAGAEGRSHARIIVGAP